MEFNSGFKGLNLSKLRTHFSAERSLFMDKTSHDIPYTPQLYVGTLRSGKGKPQLRPLLILSFRDQSVLHSICLHDGIMNSGLSNRCTWECRTCIIIQYTCSKIQIYKFADVTARCQEPDFRPAVKHSALFLRKELQIHSPTQDKQEQQNVSLRTQPNA